MGAANIFDLPDEPGALPGWLDKALVSPELPRLVGQLEAVHGASGRDGRLADVLGDLDGVLAGGAARLAPRQISTLLRHPRLLFELSALVLEFGGPHWNEVCRADPDLSAGAERAGARLLQTLKIAGRASPPGPTSLMRWAGALFVVAAGVALVVSLGVFAPRPAHAGPNMVREVNATPDNEFAAFDHLKRVFAARAAKLAEPTREAVAARLTDLIDGCDALNAKEFPRIDQGKVVDLRTKCQAWRARFAELRVTLTADNAAAVGDQTAALAKKAADALAKMADDAKAA